MSGVRERERGLGRLPHSLEQLISIILQWASRSMETVALVAVTQWAIPNKMSKRIIKREVVRFTLLSLALPFGRKVYLYIRCVQASFFGGSPCFITLIFK